MVGTAADVRLNEILAALSLACDVGSDFPMEKGLRNTLLAVRLASELGVRGEALAAIYYIGLLRFIGCSGYADETSKIFPDDNAMRGAMAPVDFGYPVEGVPRPPRWDVALSGARVRWRRWSYAASGSARRSNVPTAS